MKKLLVFCVMVFTVTKIWSQDPFLIEPSKPVEDRNFRVPLIGETAPSFTAMTTNGELRFPGDFGHNLKILFSHPQDFTPVCTT